MSTKHELKKTKSKTKRRRTLDRNATAVNMDEKLKKWFDMSDVTNTGTLDIYELEVALKNDETSSFSFNACMLMIELFDDNKNGQIDFPEFKELWSYLGEYRRRFNSADTDKSGEIDVTELSAAVELTFGIKLSDKFLKQMLRKINSSDEQRIKLDNFIRIFVFLEKMTTEFNGHQSGSFEPSNNAILNSINFEDACNFGLNGM